ncbi:hypothetical protein [Epilithonimonas mollis]|nr:hypothetical protein [Epilithonimonas mollis]
MVLKLKRLAAASTALLQLSSVSSVESSGLAHDASYSDASTRIFPIPL